LSVLKNELQNLKRVFGGRSPRPKGHRNKGWIHFGELDYGRLKALARVLVPGRVDLKRHPNLISQDNSPSLNSSLSSIKPIGLADVLSLAAKTFPGTDFEVLEICHYDFH
jgi:hypothetical protein